MVLERRLHLTDLIACGAQGCVYKTEQANTVVKVTAGKNPEINQIIWQKERGWRSHTALPRIRGRRVYRLNQCAARAGVREAYATVRENLSDLPATRMTRAAVTLLERLEAALFRAPCTHADVSAVVDRFCCRNEAALRRIQRDYMAWMIWSSISHLQIWLSRHSLTMSDVRLSNLGIRRPGLAHGVAYDIVMRDMGYLTLRGSARMRARAHFVAGYKRALPLGDLSDDPLDVL